MEADRANDEEEREKKRRMREFVRRSLVGEIQFGMFGHKTDRVDRLLNPMSTEELNPGSAFDGEDPTMQFEGGRFVVARLESNPGEIEQWTEKQWRKLAWGLKHATQTVHALQLRAISLDDRTLCYLEDALMFNRSISELDLQDNKIGDEGARVLARMLEKDTVLTNLNLATNKIGSDGARAIANALKSNMKLKAIDLGMNQIEDLGISALSFSLVRNFTLRVMWADHNPATQEARNKIASLMKDKKPRLKLLRTLYCIHSIPESSLYPLPRELLWYIWEVLFEYQRACAK